MNMRNLFLPATALSLALAACSQPAETDKTATASTDGEVAPEDKAAKRPPAIKPMDVPTRGGDGSPIKSEEHTSELQSLMRISYAVFCLKKKNKTKKYRQRT